MRGVSKTGTAGAADASSIPRAVSVAVSCLAIFFVFDDLLKAISEVHDLTSGVNIARVALCALAMAMVCWFPRTSAALLWLGVVATLVAHNVGFLPILGAVVSTVVTATTSVLFLSVNAGLMLAAVIAITASWPSMPSALFWAGAFILAASIALGLVIRALMRGSAERRRQEETIRQVREQAERARRDERLRLAHEMHDYVAHELTVTVAALAAARSDADASQHRSRADEEIFETVEKSSRQALEQLRHALRVLDDEAEPGVDATGSETALPNPSTTVSLPRLVEGAAQDLSVVGDRVQVSVAEGVGLDLGAEDLEMARRFLSEGVTNAVKHGGLGATALIRAAPLEEAVVISISNSTGRSVPTASESTGLGLRGLREEAARHGCELTSGPPGDSSRFDWTLTLRIPVHEDEPQPDDHAHLGEQGE